MLLGDVAVAAFDLISISKATKRRMIKWKKIIKLAALESKFPDVSVLPLGGGLDTALVEP